ncbi:MAG TPA: hypothetical protein VGG72_07615 [Bryobacteraceae bacterium]
MKRTWTIIVVGDVPGSFRWYQALFGQPAALLPITISGRFSIRTELSCSASTSSQ